MDNGEETDYGSEGQAGWRWGEGEKSGTTVIVKKIKYKNKKCLETNNEQTDYK